MELNLFYAANNLTFLYSYTLKKSYYKSMIYNLIHSK
jgi:hypothetical protein